MKKSTNIFISLILVACTALGQTPTYFNTNAAGGTNTFPLANAGASRKVQWFIPANSLGAVPPGNNITVVYFQTGNNATATYPIINVKLKTGSGTGLTGVGGGPIEPGMITVYTGINQNVTSTIGGWISFTLTTPFLYNPTLPLVVELEHNNTTGIGPYVYQAVPIPGPGNGRQWADYNVANLTGVGTQQINFGIDVIPATPCTGVPPSNTLFPSSFTACPGTSNPNLTFASTYSFGGLNYQWTSSTISPVGPFTAIPGATMSSAPVPTLGTTTWFQAIVTCTNPGGGTYSVTPSQFYVGPTITSTVPYTEDFENVQLNDRLPNCSWWSTNLGTSFKTYTSSASNNRLPHSGSKFAAFGAPSNNNIVYSNGIQLEPGITYSAGIWYATEYFGYNNFTNLSLLVGTSQTPTGLVQIAGVAPAITGPYKDLGGTFTVSSSGIYYIAVRANATSGSALYLSWDDLSVTIPCTGAGAVNSPTVTLSAGATTICAGDQVNLNANGADSYLWNNGSTTSGVLVAPVNTTTYTVVGTNSLTGCTTAQSQIIYVNPAPNVFALASKSSVCPGETSYLTGYNALSYAWSSGGIGNVIAVTPNATTSYSVIGTNALGCAKTAVVLVTVKPKPSITAISSSQGDVCAGELFTLTGSGGVTYQWLSSSSSQVMVGSPITLSLKTSSTFTVTGEGTNGCTNVTTLNQNVLTCIGIRNFQNEESGIQLYPNPFESGFTIESTKGEINSIEITDISGRIVSSNKPDGVQVLVNISHLASGVYYAKIVSSSGSEVVKVIKK